MPVRTRTYFANLSLRELIHELVTNTSEAVQVKMAAADKIARARKDLYDQVLDEQRNGGRPRVIEQSTGKMSIHTRCYDRLVESYTGDINQAPMATSFEARFQSICPLCRITIPVGENIIVTSVEGWRNENA